MRVLSENGEGNLTSNSQHHQVKHAMSKQSKVFKSLVLTLTPTAANRAAETGFFSAALQQLLAQVTDFKRKAISSPKVRDKILISSAAVFRQFQQLILNI